MKLTPLLVSTFISTVPFYPLYAMEEPQTSSSHSLPAKMNSDDDAFSTYSYLLKDIEEKEVLARKAAITTKLLPLFGDQQSSGQCARVVRSALKLSVEESTARGDAIAKSVLTLFGDQRSSWTCLSTVSDAFGFSAEEINARGKAITTSVLPLFEKLNSEERAEIVNAAFTLSAKEITPRAQAIAKVILPLFGDQHSSWPCLSTVNNAFKLSVE
ncbi:MAG: hypothetical protein HYX35_03190, partial [Proteobacteria bacterium]|nr:hypothetical protein [Pseudomonadota bacterium]